MLVAPADQLTTIAPPEHLNLELVSLQPHTSYQLVANWAVRLRPAIETARRLRRLAVGRGLSSSMIFY